VMEMCIDNPRTGFSNIFDTHPPIDARIAALVKFAGGHDPGPIALPEPDEASPDAEHEDETQPSGPWGGTQEPAGGDKPFLPARPPIELPGSSAAGTSDPGSLSGPWGPHRK